MGWQVCRTIYTLEIGRLTGTSVAEHGRRVAPASPPKKLWRGRLSRAIIREPYRIHAKTCADSNCSSNLATYATLFGLPWLEPIIWKWQSYLLSKSVDLLFNS